MTRFLRAATLVFFAVHGAFALAGGPPQTCPTIAMAPMSLPNGDLATAYTSTVTSSGGTAPVAIDITHGILPNGVNLTDNGDGTATFSGTATQTGAFEFTITATDVNGCSGGRTYATTFAAATQTITYTSTASVGATVGGPAYNVTATATSGLPVAFTIDATASAVCSVAGSTVSFIGVGTCVIDANQAGNATYDPAPQVQQNFAVGQGAQTITFTSTAPATATVGGATYAATATSTSGLPVTLTIDATASAICSIASSTVSFTAVGTCVIDANQAGDANYSEATQVQQTFAVGQGSQTITFTSTAPAAAAVDGPPYNVTATGGASGNPVTFAIDATATSVCSIAASTVSFIAAGTCVIDANQAGNASYTAAPQVQQLFVVSKQNQTISFTSIAPVNAKVSGPTYTVSATATSSLAVTFSIDAASASACAIAGAVVSFVHATTCIIDANQVGNGAYNAAPQVQQTFSIAKGDQTINVTSTAPAFGSSTAVAVPHTYTMTGTTTSGLAIVVSIDGTSTAGACSVVNPTVTFGANPGSCVMDIDQTGNADWNPAPQVQQSTTVEVPVNAGADIHAVTGNVAISVSAGGGVLNNDTGSPTAISSYGVNGNEAAPGTATPTAQGGSVTLNANGSYSFTPKPNFNGTDTFKYVVANHVSNATATVSLVVSNRIMVVTAAGGGSCIPASPCTLVIAGPAASVSPSIDLVYVEGGTYNSAQVQLNNNQKFVGGAVDLITAISDAGIALAPDSVAPANIAVTGRAVFNNSAQVLSVAGNNLVEYFNINLSAGPAISIGNVTTGATVHDVAIVGTGTATGVNISGNSTGSTFNFSNLVISTAGGLGFSDVGPGAATSGGTINVTSGSIPNTVSTSTNSAIEIINTTIGTGNVTFQSVNAGSAASGPSLGIVLRNTGASGGFIVTGDGGGSNNGSGGTIQNTIADGIRMTDVSNVSLGYMNIINSGSTGINVIPVGWTQSPANTSTSNGVKNFTLNRCNLSDNAGAAASDDGLLLSNASGNVSLTNNSINLSRHQGITLDNFSVNMASLVMTGNTVSNTVGGDGVLMQMRGTSVLTIATIGGSVANANTFSNNSSTGFQSNTADTGNILAMTISNNIFIGNNAGADLDLSPTNTNMSVTVQNNTFNNHHTTALNLVAATGVTGGTLSATLRGNTIGTQGVLDSGSAIGTGIRIANGGNNVFLNIDSNVIREVPNGRGIDVEPQAYVPNLTMKAKIVNNQIVRPSGTNQNIGCGLNVPCPSASVFVLSDNNGVGGFSHGCTVISGNTAYDPTSYPAGGEAAFYMARRTTTSNTLQLEGNTGQTPAQNVLNNNTVTNFTAANFIDEGVPAMPVVVVAAGTCGTFPP